MRRYITLAAIFLVIVVIGAIGLSYLASTHSVKVIYEHAHDVKVVDASDSEEANTNAINRTIKKSGDSLRLSKKSSYIVTYKGDTDYSDGTAAIDATTNEITIRPDYSTSKYQQLLSSNSTAIVKAITDTYPTASTLYTITPKEMYDYGNWALVTLVYNGDYGDNSDTLKVLLQKKDSSWTLATKPDITFNKFTYLNVPREILDTVNDTSVSQ